MKVLWKLNRRKPAPDGGQHPRPQLLLDGDRLVLGGVWPRLTWGEAAELAAEITKGVELAAANGLEVLAGKWCASKTTVKEQGND